MTLHSSECNVLLFFNGFIHPCIVLQHSSLKDYLPVFNECVDTFLERLRPHADGKTEVSMKEAFHKATLDAISKVRKRQYTYIKRLE